MTLSCYNLVCLVKPRRTRKEELQEAARQRVAAALAQSNTRNRVYGGQGTEGRKAGGPRRSKGTIISKPTPVKGIEHDGGRTTVKPANSAASNLQDGKYHDWFTILSLGFSLPPPPSHSSFHLFLPFFLPFFFPSFLSILPIFLSSFRIASLSVCLPTYLPSSFFPPFLPPSLSSNLLGMIWTHDLIG